MDDTELNTPETPVGPIDTPVENDPSGESNGEENTPMWYDDILAYVIALKPEYENTKEFLVHLILSVELKMKSLQNRVDTRKDFTDFEIMWLKMATMELITRHEQTGNVYAKVYSENGYKVEFDSSFLSKSLTDMIYPRAKAYTVVE